MCKLKLNIMSRLKKMVFSVFTALYVFTTNISYAYASPKIVSGTVNLLKSVTGWLLLIIPVGAGAFLGYQALQKSMTDDQAVIAEKNKLMKNTLIGAAIAVTADGLATLFLSYYQ